MTRRILRTVCLLLAAGPWVFAQNPRGAADRKQTTKQFELITSAFQNGGMIPKEFTCDGANISPALQWAAPPAGTQSFALIMDDPDAPGGTWVHWVVFDLPGSARELPENVPADAELSGGGRHGESSFGKLGYGGPCPPHGPAHRYFFKLYALRAKTGLKPGVTKDDLERAMKDVILMQTELVGRYHR
jgi:Raf kinase inhibitor-like YbhB/YbcL family protein